MLFLVDEWIGLDAIRSLPGYEDADKEILEAILEEAGRFCSTELLPLNATGDEHGAVLKGGNVITPPGFKEAYQEFIDNGWMGIASNPDHGGQGLPNVFKYLVDEMLGATNMAFKLYSELTNGAYHCLASHGSEELRLRYLPKMVEGTWSGTMCLTEPHCGTDLGLLKSKATATGDGSYQISGTKIFITSGDHDLTENILHLCLARIDGAPDGSRGISLFLVPKFLVNDDGSLGERNHVSTGSIEHKMGIRASATCVLNFDEATGYLVGEENRGLAAMFRMMNFERITVGLQGLGIADIAYQNALRYAQERLQSRAPGKRPDTGKAADPIVYQPEIKRKLLMIRSQVEGARALAIYAGKHVDIMEQSQDAEANAAAENTVALLTPVIKSFLSDLGVSSSLAGQQVFGGHGYVNEHGMEQLVRDCRITQIYEGTNEVQAADLVTRKISGRNGHFADEFLQHWQDYLDGRSGDESLAAYVKPTAMAMSHLRDATLWIRDKLDSDPAAAMGAATDYQRLFGLTVIACLWTDIVATIAGKTTPFHDTKRKTGRFYMDQVLPETQLLHSVITQGGDSLSEFSVSEL